MSQHYFSGSRDDWINIFFQGIKNHFDPNNDFPVSIEDLLNASKLNFSQNNIEFIGTKNEWINMVLNPMLFGNDINDPSGEQVYNYLRNNNIITQAGANVPIAGGSRRKRRKRKKKRKKRTRRRRRRGGRRPFSKKCHKNKKRRRKTRKNRKSQ